MSRYMDTRDLRTAINSSVQHVEWTTWSAVFSERIAAVRSRNDSEDVASEVWVRLGTESNGFTQYGDDHLYWFELKKEMTERKYAAKADRVYLITRSIVSSKNRSAHREAERVSARAHSRSARRDLDSNLFAAFPESEVADCVDRLPEPHQTLCRLDFWSKKYLSEAEAAASLGHTPNQVKSMRRTYKIWLSKCLLDKNLGLGEGGRK